MKTKLNYITFVLVPLIVILGFCNSIKKSPKTELIDDVLKILNAEHYQPLAIDDTFSNRVYTLFLNQLDERKIFFTQKDFDNLEKYRYKLDDEVNSKNYALFNTIATLYAKRIEEAESYSTKSLSQKFVFNLNDEIQLPNENRVANKDAKELANYWDKYIQFLVLDNFARKIIAKEDAIAKKDSTFKIQENDSLLKKAIEETEKNQKEWFKRLRRLTEKEYFDMYLNAISAAFDPHTNYFPPREKEDFDIKLSGQFEGIGATLSERDGYIKVENIVPGSASYRQGDLKAGDLIIAVAQDKEVAVNTVDMSVGDIVQLIRGKKGTIVVLTVKRGDGTTKVIPIERDVVVIEEGYAKSAIINDNENKVGYINLPSFYADFNRNGGRSSAEDVAQEVLKLNKESIKGLVIDLRYNGGGSLGDVVEMVGLFTGRGAAVQVKSRNQEPNVYASHTPNAIYNGPLIVLTNYYSASASEILAAALQDYGRAIIIGTKHTFGKGTVQKFTDLDNLFEQSQNGSVKLTIQKFYRVNGGTTQFMGVIPDIVIPDRLDYAKIGEKDLDFPLMNDLVKPAIAPKTINPNGLLAIKNSSERIIQNPYFQNQKQISAYFNEQNQKQTYSLNLNSYKKFLLNNRVKQEQLDSIKFQESIKLSILESDKLELQSDTTKLKIRTDWVNSFSKDAYLVESIKVIRDLLKE